MRASQRPGASISAGVGSSAAEFHSRARPSCPARSTTPSTNVEPRCTCSARQRQAEQPAHEAIGRIALDPPPSQRFGEHPVRREDVRADAVHHVIGDADDERDERVELRHEGVLCGRARGTEEHLWVGERRLQARHALRIAEVEASEAIFERAWVGLVGRRRTRASGRSSERARGARSAPRGS